MGNLYTVTDSPISTRAYIFGSYLHSDSPADIDLLIVYDEKECVPAVAYQNHKRLIEYIGSIAGLSVHPTLLTCKEEKHSEFIANTGAVSIETVLDDI